jgi:hypothetical protein
MLLIQQLEWWNKRFGYCNVKENFPFFYITYSIIMDQNAMSFG